METKKKIEVISDSIPILKCFKSNDDIKIYPISDLHIGSRECLEKEFLAFKKKLLTEPNSYITIGGDMMNNGIKSSISPYDDIMKPGEQKLWLINNLSGLEEKTLCVVPGNHEYRTAKEVDANPLFDVCCTLGIDKIYRANAAFIAIRIGNQKGSGINNPTYTGCVMHGDGGGTSAGAAIAKNEKFGYGIDGIDFLIVGHSHKPADSVPSKIVFDKHNMKITERPFRVIISTAWTRPGGYGLRKQYLPATHNLNELVLSGNEKKMRVTQ